MATPLLTATKCSPPVSGVQVKSVLVVTPVALLTGVDCVAGESRLTVVPVLPGAMPLTRLRVTAPGAVPPARTDAVEAIPVGTG